MPEAVSVTDGPWRVWCYAVRPGWEDVGGNPTRNEALAERDEILEEGIYPSSRWVRVIHRNQGRPKVDPPRHEIERARQEVAANA